MVPSQHYQAGPTGSTSGQEEQRNPPFPHDTRVQSGSPAIAPYSEGQGYVRALQSTSLHQQNLPPHHQARSEWQAGLGPPSRQTSFTFGPFPPTESARYGQQDPALLQPGQHHPQSGNFAKLAAPRPIKYLVPVFERDGQYFQHPSYPVEPIFEEPDWSSQAYSQGQYRYPAARELEPAVTSLSPQSLAQSVPYRLGATNPALLPDTLGSTGVRSFQNKKPCHQSRHCSAWTSDTQTCKENFMALDTLYRLLTPVTPASVKAYLCPTTWPTEAEPRLAWL